MIFSRYSFSVAILIAGAGLQANLQAQGYPCSNSTQISGEGEWPFVSVFDHWNEYGLLYCAIPDDTARFWHWSATVPGNYKVFTTGLGTTSLGISTADGCSGDQSLIVGCRMDNNLPIYLLGATVADPFLVEITAYYGGSSKRLVAKRILCGAGHYTEDNLEDNDTPQTAVVIGEGTYANLQVHSNDPDFYEVLIPAGEILIVQATHSDVDTRVTIFDDQGQLIEERVEGHLVRYEPGTGAPQRATIRVDIDAVLSLDNCSSYDLVVVTHPLLPSEQVFCNPAIPNSTGASTVLKVFDRSYPIPGTLLQAYADDGPPGEFGYLIAGSHVQNVGLPMGNQPICVGGAIARYNIAGTVWNSLGLFDATGRWSSFENQQPGYDGPNNIPSAFLISNDLPNGLGSILSGQSWGFQLWHRDVGGGTATSNGVQVTW